MARVRTISGGRQSVREHPTEVDCTLQTVIGEDGMTLLQLSSFGSDARASSPKVSQTLQFDRDSAQRLRDYIDRTFPS